MLGLYDHYDSEYQRANLGRKRIDDESLVELVQYADDSLHWDN
jgi:hypothetical protein